MSEYGLRFVSWSSGEISPDGPALDGQREHDHVGGEKPAGRCRRHLLFEAEQRVDEPERQVRADAATCNKLSVRFPRTIAPLATVALC